MTPLPNFLLAFPPPSVAGSAVVDDDDATVIADESTVDVLLIIDDAGMDDPDDDKLDAVFTGAPKPIENVFDPSSSSYFEEANAGLDGCVGNRLLASTLAPDLGSSEA